MSTFANTPGSRCRELGCRRADAPVPSLAQAVSASSDLPDGGDTEVGLYQIRYPGPGGRMRTGLETYERKSDADKALVLIESQMASGEWTDPERGKPLPAATSWSG